MEKLIEVSWCGKDEQSHNGTAIVEYADYVEDGIVINEIMNIFLPEGIPLEQHKDCKEEATNYFHNTL